MAGVSSVHDPSGPGLTDLALLRCSRFAVAANPLDFDRFSPGASNILRYSASLPTSRQTDIADRVECLMQKVNSVMAQPCGAISFGMV